MSIIIVPKPNPDAKLQMICVPFAGGGARAFLNWHKHLPDIEMCLVSYPGREDRIKEAPIQDVTTLLDILVEDCKNVIRKDFVIFGHSMGSIVSYGLAKKLEEIQLIPRLLCVSAAAAPTRYLEKDKMLSLLPDEKFIKELVERYKAIPDIILQDSNLMNMFIPMLRNDISIEEQYIIKYGSKDREGSPRLSCDVAAFGGVNDVAISKSHLLTWKNLTLGSFFMKMFPGGHFYLNESPAVLFKELLKMCCARNTS